MSKRKKTQEHPSGDAVVSVPVEGDLTSPDLVSAPAAAQTAEPTFPQTSLDDDQPFGGPEPDTQVGPVPVADSWDGPTNVGTEDEMAELAAASISHGEPAVESGEADALLPDAAAADDPAAEAPPEVAPGRLANIIESLLFASDRPLTLAELKRHVGERDSGKLTAAIEDLRSRRAESGVQVVQVAGGYQLRTNPENVAWVSRILAGKPPRLSRAMLETLAIVAYRQPITRPEIDEIRGVDCGPVLKTLLERGLVRMIGKKEEVGRPILYGTTPEFLRTFSLRDLTELPTLREFHELGEAEKAKVDAAEPATVADAPPAPVRPPAIREVDPAEEDELLTELDRAASAASKAAAPPAETVEPAEAPLGPDDETVG